MFLVRIILLIAFIFNSLGISVVQAQDFVLPKPGVMVRLSPPMDPPILKGIKVHPDNPFKFDFILDKGDSSLSSDELKDESNKLIKYFLASLTIPEKDLWVNLSPYEKDRIIPESFGETGMGRDLLAEDYMLKQITASLIYPEDEVGKKFWKRIYEEAQKKYGTTNVPVNTFNKVWIVPEKAVVYENAKVGAAYVAESKLKVMLEEDYLSLEKHSGAAAVSDTHALGSQIVREIVIPELTKEVNEGENFAKLRQVYNSLILAAWYKKKIKDSILSQVYADKSKTQGVNIDDPKEKERIYQQYLKAFKKGVYNFIKEDIDPVTHEATPRKYFSGGVAFGGLVSRGATDLSSAAAMQIEAADALKVNRLNVDNVRLDVLEAGVVLPKIDASAADQTPVGARNSTQSSIQAPQQANKRESPTRSQIPVKKHVDYAMTAEARQAIGNLLQTGKSMFLSPDADAIDTQLFEYSLKENKRYLRLTLRNQDDLDRAKITSWVDQEGKTHVGPGALIELLRKGGILLIDYNGSDPKIVGGLNSLFDKEPYFENEKFSADKVRIIGVIEAKRLGKYSSDFNNRFKMPLPEGSEHVFKDDENLKPQAVEGTVADSHVIDLWNSPFVEDRLLGKPGKDTSNKYTYIEGEIVRAIKEGKSSVVIRGGIWEDAEDKRGKVQVSELKMIIRSILMRNTVQYNGIEEPLPEGFRILRQDVQDYTQGVEEKSIAAAGEESSNGDVWVVNNFNQDLLFNRTSILDNQIATSELPALLNLPSGETLHLRITEKLDDWVWHYIMHAQGKIQIEVNPGVQVPGVYSKFQSTRSISSSRPKIKTQSWEETRDAQVVMVESEDLEFAKEKIKARDSQAVFYSVTPQTSQNELVSSTDVKKLASGSLEFHPQAKEIIKALQEGRTVVLEGADANPTLFKELESVLYGHPYIVDNGRRITFTGKLYFTVSKDSMPNLQADHRTVLSADEKGLASVLGNEQGFDSQKLKTILKVQEALNKAKIPVNLTVSKLRLMFKYENLADALREVVAEPYFENPETAAAIRTIGRIYFSNETQTNQIDGTKLNGILNKYGMILDGGWEGSFWQLADTLSVDLLRESGIQDDLNNKSAIIKKIKEAIFKKRLSNDPIGAQGYLSIGADVSHAPDLVLESRKNSLNEMPSKVLQALNKTPLVMLIGLPGTGKSYTAREVAKLLGLPVIGPITIGPDTREEHVVSAEKLTDEGTVYVPEAIEEWANLADGGVLIIDEANLAKNGFWNLLKGLFDENPYIWINGQKKMLTKNHKVIFTGNPESFPGRNHQDIVEQYGLTIHFEPFTREELKQIMTATDRPYVPQGIANREELIERILDLHFFFEGENNKGSFSLRDIQELSERVLLNTKGSWTMRDIVMQAWSVYKGHFSLEEQFVLQQAVILRFGINIHEVEKKEIKDFIDAHKDSFARNGVALVETNARIALTILDSLRMRYYRMNGQRNLDGKRGLIFEGPSGVGKDIMLDAVIGLLPELMPEIASGEVKTYRLTANLTPEEMTRTIEKAKKEGSIVIISEMNLLPSSFLEGKLNDLLTGDGKDIKAGFMLFATNNSADFSGREVLSSALLNRVIYEKINDYTESEFKAIADLEIRRRHWNVSQQDVQYAVKAHVWIRDQIASAGRRPTVRKLLEVLERKDLDPNISIEDAFQEVYGPYYLHQVLNRSLPTDLMSYERNSLDKMTMLQGLGSFILPASRGVMDIGTYTRTNNKQPPAYHRSRNGNNDLIVLERALLTGDPNYLIEVFCHELAHAWLTVRNLNNDLEQDLEDWRNERFFKNQFPHSTLGTSEMTPLHEWLMADPDKLPSAREVFRYIILSYMNDQITKADLESAELQDIIRSMYDDQDIVGLVLKHLDKFESFKSTIPSNRDEENIHYQDFRAGEILSDKQLVEDWNSLPSALRPKKEVKEDKKLDQEEEAQQIKEELGKQVWEPAAADKEKPVVQSKKLNISDSMKKAARNARFVKYGKKIGMGVIGLGVLGAVGAGLYHLGNHLDLSSAPTVLPRVDHVTAPSVSSANNISPWTVAAFVLASVGISLGAGYLIARLFPSLGTGSGEGSDKANIHPDDMTANMPAPVVLTQNRQARDLKDQEINNGPFYEKASQDSRQELILQMEGFVQERLGLGWQTGRVGPTIDMAKFIRTGEDISKSRRYLGGELERGDKKEIYLQGLPVTPTPIMLELIRFLREQGFVVMALSSTFTEEDLKAKKKNTQQDQYEVMDYKDFQRIFEHIYLDHFFQEEANKQSFEQESQTLLPESQLQELGHMLTPYMAADFNSKERNKIFLLRDEDRPTVPVRSMSELINNFERQDFLRLTDVVYIGLEKVSFLAGELTRLREFKGLLSLDLKGAEGLTEKEIFTFWVNHPNAKELVITMPDGSTIEYDNIPSEYKTPVAQASENGQKELTIDEQETQLNSWLEQAGFTSRVLNRGNGKLTLGLTDNGFNVLDFSLFLGHDFSPFKNVTRINLVNQKIDVPKLDKFNEFDRLELFSALATEIDDKKLYEFLANHPNRRNLIVITSEGKELTFEDLPEEYRIQREQKELTIDEQKAKLEDLFILQKPLGKVGVTQSEGLILSLDIPRILQGKLVGFFPFFMSQDFHGFKDVRTIELKGASWSEQHLAKLNEFENLTYLNLKETQFTESRIYQFWVNHPNARNMIVIMSDGSKHKYGDIPSEYKEQAASNRELTIDEQQQRVTFALKLAGFKSECVKYQNGLSIVLKYDKKDPPDIIAFFAYDFSGFKNVHSIQIFGWEDRDVDHSRFSEILNRFENLEYLNFKDTRSFTRADLFRLLANHPNKKLVVRAQYGETQINTYTYDDVPESYKTKDNKSIAEKKASPFNIAGTAKEQISVKETRPLSLAEQKYLLEQIVVQKYGPVSDGNEVFQAIENTVNSNYLRLKLSQRAKDLSGIPFEQLSGLEVVILDKTNIDDLSPLLRANNLKYLIVPVFTPIAKIAQLLTMHPNRNNLKVKYSNSQQEYDMYSDDFTNVIEKYVDSEVERLTNLASGMSLDLEKDFILNPSKVEIDLTLGPEAVKAGILRRLTDSSDTGLSASFHTLRIDVEDQSMEDLRPLRDINARICSIRGALSAEAIAFLNGNQHIRTLFFDYSDVYLAVLNDLPNLNELILPAGVRGGGVPLEISTELAGLFEKFPKLNVIKIGNKSYYREKILKKIDVKTINKRLRAAGFKESNKGVDRNSDSFWYDENQIHGLFVLNVDTFSKLSYLANFPEVLEGIGLVYISDQRFDEAALNELLKAKKLMRLRFERQDFTDEEEAAIRSFWEKHPNKDRLGINLKSGVSALRFDGQNAINLGSQPKTPQTPLAELIGDLVDPQAALEKVREHFKERGKEKEFDQILSMTDPTRGKSLKEQEDERQKILEQFTDDEARLMVAMVEEMNGKTGAAAILNSAARPLLTSDIVRQFLQEKERSDQAREYHSKSHLNDDFRTLKDTPLWKAMSGLIGQLDNDVMMKYFASVNGLLETIDMDKFRSVLKEYESYRGQQFLVNPAADQINSIEEALSQYSDDEIRFMLAMIDLIKGRDNAVKILQGGRPLIFIEEVIEYFQAAEAYGQALQVGGQALLNDPFNQAYKKIESYQELASKYLFNTDSPIATLINDERLQNVKRFVAIQPSPSAKEALKEELAQFTPQEAWLIAGMVSKLKHNGDPEKLTEQEAKDFLSLDIIQTFNGFLTSEELPDANFGFQFADVKKELIDSLNKKGRAGVAVYVAVEKKAMDVLRAYDIVKTEEALAKFTPQDAWVIVSMVGISVNNQDLEKLSLEEAKRKLTISVIRQFKQFLEGKQPGGIGYTQAYVSVARALRDRDRVSESKSVDIFNTAERKVLDLLKSSAAMSKQNSGSEKGFKRGGIDFNIDKLNLEIQSSAEGSIKFHLDPAMLQQLRNAPGFEPIITNIQPMTDLREFLGLNV